MIFSQFTSHLDIIGKTMKGAGHSFVRIDGSVCAANRISAISRFNSDDADSPRFILCSLLASGTGINLTRANWCFMMDVWWNDAVESQAMDRSTYLCLSWFCFICNLHLILPVASYIQSIAFHKPERFKCCVSS